MSIKYYQLAKDEELPDEFCAVRDVDGEPSEYTFYVPETENAKLREEFNKMDVWHSKELTAAMDENAKLRELASGMYGMLATFDAILGNHDACETPRPLIFGEDKSFKDVMRELGVEVDG